MKYWSKKDTNYLYNAIGTNFRFTVDIERKDYYILSLKWNYKLGYVDIPMPKYASKTLQKLLYQPKVSQQYLAHKHNPI